jgi:hypothetical protein
MLDSPTSVSIDPLQENRGNGKNMEHMGGCPSLYPKKLGSESLYPELRLGLGLSTVTVKRSRDTGMCLE